MAAEILNLAFLSNDIKNKRVLDLGCGSGKLTIGSVLLGAREVIGVDIDEEVLNVANENLKIAEKLTRQKFDSRIKFIKKDVSEICEKVDTAIQNPPFGIQKLHADRLFLKKALECGDKIYSLHRSYEKTREFLNSFVKENKGTVIHTAVGSPIVARVMIEKNSIFGGEGNGGLIFPEFQYCRDSAMTIAKILEIMARENKKLSELIDELPKLETFNTKMPCPNDKKNIVMKTLTEQTKKDKNIIKIDTTDGVKLYLSDGWVLMRPSGTEPIFRVYSESKDKKRAEEIVSTYKKITQEIIDKNS